MEKQEKQVVEKVISNSEKTFVRIDEFIKSVDIEIDYIKNEMIKLRELVA